MKQKLTLSLKPSRIALLRKASARRSTSISDLVEQFAEKMGNEPTDEKPAILKWAGAFADFVSPSDFQADDRVGEELRKTRTYRRMERERKKAR